ncbi:MAG: NAD(P)H-hydrate dehydratase [candidate division Zixibacteria bacterium]|nr:NAD(P)H-hydrate dehydratase [candidate division Zixibacteria bacterium]
MKLATTDQMRQIDREAIQDQGIPGPELMENAGRGIAERLLSFTVSADVGEKVSVFCGKGNNGGDGFVVSRYLYRAGVQVTIYFIGPIDKLSVDARLNFDRAAGIGIDLIELRSANDLPDKLECDCIIDAIFGTGFSGSPRGLAAEVIEYINRQSQIVVAVDTPSGLNADNGSYEGTVVRADQTFTLALPKYGLFVSPGRELSGEVQTVPIGIPDNVVDGFNINVELITPELVSSRLPARKPDGHKGDFGKLFVLAGSTGMTGAAAMAAKSGLRCGCGLVKVGCPATVLPMIATLAMEATSHPLPDVAKKGALALRGLGEMRKLAAEHDAVAIGPGLGQHHETGELIRRFVATLEKPVIADADGLNALAGHMNVLKGRANESTVLTPHEGEFRRLNGGERVPVDIHKRIVVACNFARDHKVILVLKGSPSLVAEPGGMCYLNPTGNSGMATAGSGDVLTGAIGSFLAQGMSCVDAAVCGVYIHGMVGDLAAGELTERAMIATDMIDFLSEAFELLEQ